MNAGTYACGLEPSSEYVDLDAEVLGILSDPTRVRIVLALRQAEELPVNALAEIVEKTPSGVSQHLAKLRMARLVTTRRKGTSVLYRLADEHALAVVIRSEEHTSELQSRGHLVCRLLLEKK